MSRETDDLPLFKWAANRPPEPASGSVHGIVIDATQRFLAREVAFLRLLMIGFRPPTSGGAEPIILADVRQARQMLGRVANDAKGAA